MTDTAAHKSHAKPKKSPLEALQDASASFVKAANAYAASEEGRTVHTVTLEDFRVLYQGEQLYSLTRR